MAGGDILVKDYLLQFKSDCSMRIVKKNGSLRLLFAGGGTGGHLYPAIAIAEEVLRRHPDAEIHFVGTRHGLEARVIPKLGYQLHWNVIRGFQRGFSLDNLLLPFRVFVSMFQCLGLLYKVGPWAVIGSGGYVSGPTLFFSALLGIPTLIQEQNSYPGATTRFLAHFVGRVHLSFEESRKYFRSQKKLSVSGNPVRRLFNGKESKEARTKLGLETQRITLLVFGGSQGAHAINQAMIKSMPEIINKTTTQVIWGTGRSDYQIVKMETQKFGSRVRVFEYIDDMQNAYSASDLVVCRSGASTLAEITICGLPSILIPYPYAAAGHQEANARSLEKVGAASVILQSGLNGESLAKVIIELITNKTRRINMGKIAKAISYPNAAQEIVDSLLELISISGSDKKPGKR